MSKINSEPTKRVRRSQGRAAVRVQPLVRPFRDEMKEAVRCHLHNTGATLAGNTQSSDIEWFARWLYGASNFGGGWTETFHWSLNNAEFEKLGLIPDRPWTGYRWETLPPKRKAAWMKLSRLCLYALPHICERIGHRFMEQAQGLRDSQEWPNARTERRLPLSLVNDNNQTANGGSRSLQ